MLGAQCGQVSDDLVDDERPQDRRGNLKTIDGEKWARRQCRRKPGRSGLRGQFPEAGNQLAFGPLENTPQIADVDADP